MEGLGSDQQEGGSDTGTDAVDLDGGGEGLAAGRGDGEERRKEEEEEEEEEDDDEEDGEDGGEATSYVPPFE